MIENNIVEIDGYPTFNNVEDEMIRDRNRGNIILNICEDTVMKGGTQEEAWATVKRYMSCIPPEHWERTYAAAKVAKAHRYKENLLQ